MMSLISSLDKFGSNKAAVMVATMDSEIYIVPLGQTMRESGSALGIQDTNQKYMGMCLAKQLLSNGRRLMMASITHSVLLMTSFKVTGIRP